MLFAYTYSLSCCPIKARFTVSSSKAFVSLWSWATWFSLHSWLTLQSNIAINKATVQLIATSNDILRKTSQTTQQWLILKCPNICFQISCTPQIKACKRKSNNRNLNLFHCRLRLLMENQFCFCFTGAPIDSKLSSKALPSQ